MLPSSRGNDTTSSSRLISFLSLIDEDEKMNYWGNEEDEEGYNDNDNHYVDVEDECGLIVVDKLVILMCFLWMICEFGQGICICILTCSIDNFYGF